MTPATPAARRYFRQAAAAFAAYVVLTAGVVLVASEDLRFAALTVDVAALAPAAAVVAAVWATQRYLAREADTVQRAIQIEALLWAVGVTFAVATGWGLLGARITLPQPPSYCAFAVFASVVASVQVARRLFPKPPASA